MNFSDLKYKANYYAILLLAFVIPLERKLAPPLIIIFLITSILNKKSKPAYNHTILIFPVLFMLYLLGVFYSTDVSYSFNIIVEKLSLLIFPVAIYLSNLDFKKHLFSILFSFIEGCFISSVLSVIVATIGFYFNHDISLFFYGNISNYLHSSYFAMYLSFGIITVYFLLSQPTSNYHLNPAIGIFLQVYFSIFIILLSSKTGIISLIMIHSIATLYLIIKNKAYIKGLLAVILMFSSSILIYNTSAIVQGRINELVSVVQSGDTSDGSSTGARVEIWKIATELIKEKPLIGYGTGDVRDVLTVAYEQKGFKDYADKHLNAHNQFLQTSIALGLIGGITLIILLVVPLFLALKTKDYLFMSYVLLIILNFLTESMLERQTGVVFYALFNSLLYANFVAQNKTLNSKL